jgi:molecular chaperone DnaK (HSP70)
VSKQEEILFGIHLGTTTSSIAYVNEQGKVVVIPNEANELATPSMVLFEDENWVVGNEAKKMVILNPDNVVERVIQHVGDVNWRYNHKGRDYTSEEIVSYILRKLIDDTEEFLNVPVKNVVIACSADFNASQRKAIELAGKMADLNVYEVISEPIAAVVAYDLPMEKDQVVLVYDLEGSTFSVTVIEIKNGNIAVIATSKNDNLGEYQWNEAVVKYLREQWIKQAVSLGDPFVSLETRQLLWEKAEQAKVALVQRKKFDVSIRHAGNVIKVTLTREKFNELTTSLLNHTLALTRLMVQNVRSRGYSHIEQILLVGSSAGMPQLKEALEREFNISLKASEPSLGVVRGTAIYAKKLMDSRQLQDKTIAEKLAIKLPDKRGTYTKTRPNFFILLGLNPNDVWEQTVFNSALKAKRSEWSRQGSWAGQKALIAKQNLALIPEINRIMADEALRITEAVEARAILASEREARFQIFEGQLAFINRASSIEEADLNKIIIEFQDILTPDEIKAYIKVPINMATIKNEQMILPLDSSMVRRVADLLQIVKLKTLYDVLQLPTSARVLELYRAAEDLYKTTVRRMPKTAEVTAITELAGLAMEVFKSEDMRRRYDESLRQGTIDVLLQAIDAVVSRSAKKRLEPDQVILFLENARQIGWAQEEALSQLKAFGLKHKWSIELPDTLTPKVKCGKCGELNNKSNKKCTNCAYDLYIECPTCGESIASDQGKCGNCGFNIGYRVLVDGQLEVMESMIKVGDLGNFTASFSELERTWQPRKANERSQKIEELKQRAKNIEAARQQAVGDELEVPKRSEHSPVNNPTYVETVASGTFLIRYHEADRDWAEWIAWELEEAGYTTILPHWDFQVGVFSQIEMQKSITKATSVIVVLSSNYLRQRNSRSELSQVMEQTLLGGERTLLPICVRDCGSQLSKVMPSITYISFIGLDESEARRKLLASVRRQRIKPESRPNFPIHRSVEEQPGFPPSQKEPQKVFTRRLSLEIKKAFAKKDWPDVIRKTQLLIQRDSSITSPEIYYFQGRAFLEKGEIKPACEALKTALALASDLKLRLTLLQTYCEALILSGDWEKVLVHTREALQLAPQDPYWQTLLTKVPISQRTGFTGSTQASHEINIFISYCHKDKRWRETLEIYLSNLKEQFPLTCWHDGELQGGQEWQDEIKIHLNNAHIIILLVSPDFLYSKYCFNIEMKHALDRHQAGTAHVIPILLRPSGWNHTPLHTLQALPRNGKPIPVERRRQEQAFVDIAEEIQKVVEGLLKKQ